MKKIDTTQVTDPTVLQPFTARSLKFLQDANAEDVAAIIKAIVTSNLGSYSLTVPYVISGCVVSDSNKDVTAGEIFYGGKYYETTALNGTTNVAQFVLTKTQDGTADPVTFSDASSKNVHDIYKYVPTDTATPGDFDATDLVSLYGYSAATDGYSYLAGGVIMQWGKLTGVALDQTFHAVTFPKVFPNAVFNITATISMTAAVSGAIAPLIKSSTITTSGCDIAGDNSDASGTGNIYWVAIGN